MPHSIFRLPDRLTKNIEIQAPSFKTVEDVNWYVSLDATGPETPVYKERVESGTFNVQECVCLGRNHDWAVFT